MPKSCPQRLPVLLAVLLTVAFVARRADGASPGMSSIRVNSLRSTTAQALNPAVRTADPRADDLATRLRQVLSRRQTVRRAALQATRLDDQRAFDALRQAAGSDLAVRWREDAGTPRQIRAGFLQRARGGGAAGDEATGRAFLRLHRAFMRLDDPDAELELERFERDRLGRRQLRFAQRYRTLPVWPAQLIVHLDAAGNVDVVDGAYVPTPRGVATQPTVSAAAAIDVARARIPGAGSAPTSTPALIVYAPGSRPARLAWRVSLFASERARWLVVIDAISGTTLTAFNEIMEDDVAGSGEDLNGDVRPLHAWREDGTLYLVDTSKPMYDPTSDPPEPGTTRGGITVLDARNQPPTDDPQEFPDLVYVTAPTPTGWTVPDGVSAAFGLAAVYDYYFERHERNSLDGAGGGILAVVRYGDGFQNAFWNGSLMAFGNGDNFAGTLDIVAHELTHGVTQHTANLVYMDQPGALNEALSDIFGEAVEARTFGATDWLHGSQTSHPSRNLADPGSVAICDGCPAYPARMSEFYGPDDTTLDRFVNRDNGGVHINSGIINHAFYLLADGLDGAIGLRQAEQIFYRALSQHLVANSQFVDARLACLTSARELFGAGSPQEQRTAEAFDAVEIFDGRVTPPPRPFPEVNGADATLFLLWDPGLETYVLGRREEGLGDDPGGVRLIGASLAGARPAVAGDGTYAVFVDASNDVCFVNTDGTPIDPESDTVESCLGFAGFVSSVAVSPDGERFGFVFLDDAGDPDNRISVIDLGPDGETRTFTLRAPVFDGGEINSVVNASTMDFTADGGSLVYDALNRIRLIDGSRVEAWSIYLLDLTAGTMLPLIPPVPGFDIANPALSQSSDNFLVFDVYDREAGSSTIVAADVTSGTIAEVGTVRAGLGVPGYTGDDGAIVYSESSATPTEFSLVRQALAADRLTPQGAREDWIGNADFGVIYRRGSFVGPGACAADCSGDSRVTIDELIKSVSIALGVLPVADCRAVDGNGDGLVTIDELIAAVNAGLNGC